MNVSAVSKMVENFQVGKEYPADQLQFHKDLDAYEQQTKHVVIRHENYVCCSEKVQ